MFLLTQHNVHYFLCSLLPCIFGDPHHQHILRTHWRCFYWSYTHSRDVPPLRWIQPWCAVSGVSFPFWVSASVKGSGCQPVVPTLALPLVNLHILLSKDTAPFTCHDKSNEFFIACNWLVTEEATVRWQTAESSCHMNSLRQKVSHPANIYVQWLTVLFVPLRHQRSGTFGHSSEKIHPDPAEVHQERVEAGKDRLCGHHRLCPLLVTVRLRHTHFLGWVRHISELKYPVYGSFNDAATAHVVAQLYGITVFFLDPKASLWIQKGGFPQSDFSQQHFLGSQ